MLSPTLRKLVDLFSEFPSVGPRTATRFVFYLLRKNKDEISAFSQSIDDLLQKVKICQFCNNPFEPEKKEDTLCQICSNPRRNHSLLCVVEKETDLISIEKTGKYNGLFFVLGGTVFRLRKEDLEKLKTKDLIERIKTPEKYGLRNASFKELILGFNPTTEGEATMLYLERTLKDIRTIKLSRLAKGLPLGGEMEYADEETLASALEGRKET